MRSLAAQVVIITGASSGIGEATAQWLAERGALLVLTARRGDRLEALARSIDPDGRKVLAVPGDITVDADRRRVVETALSRFGRIDALVNNAGYGVRGPLELVPVELIRKNFETNVFSLIALTQRVAPHLRAQGHGRIINIGSVAGKIARPLSSVYDATKHALEALTDGLRGELAPFGVQVSLIRPGFITTEFIEAANQASGNVMDEAGPYAPFVGNFRSQHSRMRALAAGPGVIAALVERALTAEHPAPRYAGPMHAHVFLFLRWLLPGRLFAWVIRLKRR
jgi:short-subunit dehydrogenase